MTKVLRTENAMGDKITLFSANDDEKEASYIASEIAKCQTNGQVLNEIAVLYRTNSQSDVIAQMLMQAQIPYFVAKGQRFYDRKEIKLIYNWRWIVMITGRLITASTRLFAVLDLQRNNGLQIMLWLKVSRTGRYWKVLSIRMR